MQLSRAELIRLQLMFDSGQVRSDPPTLSDADRMMDAMNRRRRAVSSQGTPAATPFTHRTNADIDTVLGVPRPPCDPQLDWTAPHSLEELLQIRQVLLRGHLRDS